MKASIKAHLFALIVLLLLVQLAYIDQVSASTSAAIVVYDHGLTKQVNFTRNGHLIVSRSSNFTQDDPVVWAYFTAALASANVTWLWYAPGGLLFQNDTREYQCDVSPCTFFYYFSLARTDAAAKSGVWRMDLKAGGIVLYSDSFSVMRIVNQDNYWSFNVIESAPPRVHADLRVTIHPSNQSWSSYVVYLPYAANITAHEVSSKGPLEVSILNDTVRHDKRVVVDLGGPRSDGYGFVLRFDLIYGAYDTLGGWDAGGFVLAWQEDSWGTFNDGYHSIPASFNITLPRAATFVDVVGLNVMTFDPTIRRGERPMISFNTTLSPAQRLGWTILYRDYAYRNSQVKPKPGTFAEGLGLVLAQPIPVLPMTMGSLSLWSAVMSIFLLTCSELISPIYSRTGIMIDRRRLRIAALILVTIFLTITAYQIIVFQSTVISQTR